MIVRDCQHISLGWSKYKLGIVKNLVSDCQNSFMSGFCPNYVTVMSGSCQGHVRVMSGSCQDCVRVMQMVMSVPCQGYVRVMPGS